jgi:hypothetical protein
MVDLLYGIASVVLFLVPVALLSYAAVLLRRIDVRTKQMLLRDDGNAGQVRAVHEK